MTLADVVDPGTARHRDAFPLVVVVAALVCTLVFFEGLAVRHRDRWWGPVAARLLPVSVAIAVAGVVGDAHGVFAVAGAVAGLTTIGIVVGALVADELPRPPLVLMVASAMAGDNDRTLWGFAALVVALVGYAWLGWVMRHEPLAEERQIDSRAGIAERGTIPETSGST